MKSAKLDAVAEWAGLIHRTGTVPHALRADDHGKQIDDVRKTGPL